jgi:hypothetical protein
MSDRLFNALIAGTIAAILGVLLMVGVSIYQESKLPPCIKSHVVPMMVPVMVGKVIVPMMQPLVICDARATR